MSSSLDYQASGKRLVLFEDELPLEHSGRVIFSLIHVSVADFAVLPLIKSIVTVPIIDHSKRSQYLLID